MNFSKKNRLSKCIHGCSALICARAGLAPGTRREALLRAVVNQVVRSDFDVPLYFQVSCCVVLPRHHTLNTVAYLPGNSQ